MRQQDFDTDEPLTLFDTDAMDLGAKPRPDRSGTADMFADADLEQQHRVKCAFDAGGLFNPGKVFPTLSACVEQGHMHVHGGRLPFPNLPRL